MELTQTGFANKLAGKSFTTESGCLCHFYKLPNYQRPYNLYSEIRQGHILLNRVAEVLKQSFQVGGENLTLLDFIWRNEHLKNDILFQNSGVKPAFLIMIKSLKPVNYIRTENDTCLSLEFINVRKRQQHCKVL